MRLQSGRSSGCIVRRSRDEPDCRAWQCRRRWNGAEGRGCDCRVGGPLVALCAGAVKNLFFCMLKIAIILILYQDLSFVDKL
jgi:hypothetical protein